MPTVVLPLDEEATDRAGTGSWFLSPQYRSLPGFLHSSPDSFTVPWAGTPWRTHPGTRGKWPLLAPLRPARCPMSGSCSSAPSVARSCVLPSGASCWSPLEPPPSALARRGRSRSGQSRGRGGCCVFVLLTELWPPYSPVGTADPLQGVVMTKS